jgi:hypothetical protein
VAIQGSIEEAGLPDVLQLLALGRKTGCLVVVDGSDVQGHIFLDVGRVSYAAVSNRPDRLGDMLVKSGRITQQQLEQAVAEQARASGHQIGRILVEAGRLERAELERFIRVQVEEAVYFLFTWTHGSFSFTSDRLPPHQSLLVPLDTESLLLEGARRVDEWSLIQKKIPSFGLVYRRSRDTLGPAAEGLTEEQRRILPLLDGTRDVTSIIDTTGMAEFDVGKALYGLVSAGFAQLVERRAHVRHLEYRELLAYTVREAEFSDAQRRKDAARHIVDCPICAERLRTMNARSTAGAGSLQSAEAQPELAVDIAPEAPLSRGRTTTARTAAAAPGLVERRARERRAGSDRRKRDRRTGTERRRAVSAARSPTSTERRIGPRREEDQWAGDSRDRRGGERIVRGVQPAAAFAAQASSVQLTAAEQPEPAAARPGDAVAPTVGAVADGKLNPPVLGTAAGMTAPDAAARIGSSSPTTASPGAVPAPTSGGNAAGPKDVEWVVTPEESLEMIRDSRVQARGADAARRGPQRPAPQTAGRAANHARSPAANDASTVASAAASLAGAGSTLDRYAAGPGAAAASEGRGRAGLDGGPQPYPVRRLAIAAGIAFVAVLGFMAGQLGGRGGSGQLAGTASPGTREPAAGAREQTPQSLAGAALASGEPVTAESVSQGAAAARLSAPSRRVAAPRAEPPARPTAEPVAPSRERPRPTAPAPVVATATSPATQPVAPAVAAPQPPPAPNVGVIRGVVRDAAGRVLPGAHVSIRGSSLSTAADGSGAFEIRDVPGGPATVLARAEGFVSGSADVQVLAGGTVSADFALGRPSTAEPDRELGAGGWGLVDRAEATSILGGTLGAIDGLPIESIAKSTTAARTRIRMAQLTQAGERIVLTETRAGAAVRGGPGTAVVTALRVMPPSEGYPWSTATASLGNILITVKTGVAVETLRSLLARLGEVPQGQ